MGNDRWNLKTFTGGSDERNGFLGKTLNSRLEIVGRGFQNHKNRRLVSRYPRQSEQKPSSQGIFVVFY